MAFAVRPHFSEFVSLCKEERERETERGRERAQGEDKKRAGVLACGRESTKHKFSLNALREPNTTSGCQW